LPMLVFVSQPHRERWIDYLRRCRDSTSGALVSVELELRSPDGPKMVELFCRPGPHASRRPREYLTSVVDISEQKRLQHEREREAHARATLATRLISIQEDERTRIARELHDNVGQQLTVLRLQFDALSRHASDEAVRAKVAQGLTTVSEIDRALDFITAELRPVSLDIGLPSAVRAFAEEWAAMAGVDVHVQMNGLDRLRLATDVETHAYRIVQESLHNVQKHAHATRVQITMERRRGTLELRIADDGVGFEPASARDQHHAFGLIGMRERTTLIGGMLDIDTTPGKGTTVLLIVPHAFESRPVSDPANGSR
jgi:signal transduction histidine kinase